MKLKLILKLNFVKKNTLISYEKKKIKCIISQAKYSVHEINNIKVEI